jgi:hypothetical protein
VQRGHKASATSAEDEDVGGQGKMKREMETAKAKENDE